MNLDYVILNGTTIISSGTTDVPKYIFRSKDNIELCSTIAVEAQSITSRSRILTVTSMNHAGGLLLQTIPAHIVGAYYSIQKFDPFTFIDQLEKYSHSFLPPKMIEALIKTKRFDQASFRGKLIVMGSDPIPAKHINAFTSRGATVLANWGMSEIGPCVINKMYYPYEETADDNIMGDTFWCDTKIIDDELHVKSNMCVYDDWFATGDLVEIKNHMMFYRGRK
jgi:acyl-coenzyme A synthetase/AMP-(fatty) acid ligase